MSEMIENLHAGLGLIRRELKDVRSIANHIDLRTRRLDASSAVARPGGLVARMATCALIARAEKRGAEDVARQYFSDDRDLSQMILRAASAPATQTTSGWAADLSAVFIKDIADTLLPQSALGQLRALGLSYGFMDGGLVKVPSHAPAPSGGFVLEGAPISVGALLLSSMTLRPKKCASIVATSRELLAGTPTNVETSLRELLSQDISLLVDSILLGSAAATTAAPGGLLAGLVALTPSASTGQTGLAADVRTLLAAIAPSVRPILIVNRQRAASLAFLSQQALPVIIAPYLPSNTVICVDAAAFVSCLGAINFEVSGEAALHFEDSSPQPIASTGTPNVVSAPVRSLFQTATLALRSLLDIDWGLRRSGAVSFTENVLW